MKAITTNEEIEKLTKSDILNLKEWQTSTLNENQIKRIIQRKHEMKIELHASEKTLIGIELTGKEVTGEIVGTIFSLGFMFLGVVVLWWLFYT